DGGSGDVTWYATDPGAGLPQRGGSVPVPAPPCLVLRCPVRRAGRAGTGRQRQGPAPRGEQALSASCVQRGQRTGDPWACGVAMPSAVVYLARASLPIAG